jgi:hypothetical protein
MTGARRRSIRIALVLNRPQLTIEYIPTSRAISSDMYSTPVVDSKNQDTWSVTCTTSCSRFVLMPQPLFSNTLSIAVLFGSTSAYSSWSPAR